MIPTSILRSLTTCLVVISTCATAVAEKGDDNPTGVAGVFNGNITTGCSYDAYTGNGLREVDDIVVPGGVGARPLKWTRYFNTHVTYTNNYVGAQWRFSYISLTGSSTQNVTLPDGRQITDEFGNELFEDAQGIHLPDGSTDFLTKVVDPYGQATTIVTSGTGAAKTTKITEPAGRYLLVSYNSFPSTSDPNHFKDGTVGNVQAFDGIAGHAAVQSVAYTWSEFDLSAPSGTIRVPVLTRVDYSDGTFATYTYTQRTYEIPLCNSLQKFDHQPVAELATANDVRYSGPMRQIVYTYTNPSDQTNPGHNGTRVLSENHVLSNGQTVMVSTIAGLSENGTSTSTETRGDGRTRTFTYNSVTRCIQCPPPDTDPCRESQPLDGKLLSFTDFQGNATALTYETDATKPSAGFIKAVKDANGNTTTYTRSSVSWAILQITHPPTASEPQGSVISQTFTDETHPYYLASRTDENGHTTVYKRNDPNNPNAITEKDYADGTSEAFTYNNFGQIITHRMTSNAYQHFSYDGRGLLSAKTNPTWTADHNTSLSTDPQTTYTYYTAADFGGVWTDRIKTETDPRGNTTTYEYDHMFDASGNDTGTPAAGRGLVTKITHPDGFYQTFGYDTFGDKLFAEDELGHLTSYNYDDYGRVLKITDPLKNVTTDDYTPSNNTTLSPYVHTTNSVYKTTTPTLIVTQNMFDENFRTMSTTAGFGTTDAATTWFQYDFVGNRTGVTDPRGTSSGDPAYTTKTDYDQRNRKWHVTDPLGHVTTFGYDPASNNTSITRPDQSVETKTYNETNKITSDRVPKSGTAASPSEFVKTTFEYYPAGQGQMVGELLHVSQLLTDSDTGAKRTTEFQYEPSGLKSKMMYPLNDSGQSDPNTFQTWTYDGFHNLIARQTVNGVSQLFSYDNRNRQIFMTWSNGLDWAAFGYDAASRMKSAQNPASTITRGYDDANRLTLDRQQLQIMPIRAVSRKSHGSAGTFDIDLPLIGTPGVECRVGQGSNSDQHQIIVTFPRAITFGSVSVKSGTGQIVSQSSSPDRTQVTINLAGVTNAQTVIVTLSGVSDGTTTNDVNIGMSVLVGDITGNGVVSNGDVSQCQTQVGSTTSTSNFRSDVDANGIISNGDVSLIQARIGSTASSSPLTQPIPSSPAIDVQYSYDGDGKNTRLYATSGGAGTAGYDLTFGYNDGQGRFKTISQTNGGAQLFRYTYDAASNETHRTNNVNALDQVYGRDSLNRMTTRTVNNSTGAVSVEVYGYDPSRPGLMTSVTHQEGQAAATHDAFGYDLLPELNSAQYNLQGAASTQAAQILSGFPVAGGVLGSFTPPTPPNRNVSYAWDRAGNRNSMTDSAGPSYNYQTTSLNQYWTDGISNMTNGSEHELASYQNVNYTYVNDSHLWTIGGTDIFGQQSKYEMYYDAFGRRVVTVLNGSTTYYICDGEKAILEYRGWSSPSAANVYGKSIDEILKRTDYTVTPASVVFYQDDHEWSITHLTDASGNIVEYYRYDVFGKPTIYNASGQQIQTSAFGNRFMFTGREYVTTFGVYEYRNRAYHPGLGRFMSEDPKLFGAKDYNLFRYVGNDPLDRSDPMGLTSGPGGEDPADTGLFTQTFDLTQNASVRLEAGLHQKDRGAIMGPLSGRVETQRYRSEQQNMMGFTMGSQSLTTTGQVSGIDRSRDLSNQGAPPNMKPGRVEKLREEDKKYFKWVHYQLETPSGAPLRENGYSITEHMKVLKNTAGSLFEFTENQPMSMYKGEALDRVGPKFPPSKDTSGDIVVRQTFTATYGTQLYPLSTVVEQRTHIDHGAATVEVPVIKP